MSLCGPISIQSANQNQVDAMILYGDPRHNAVAAYNIGTATQDGIFIRPTNQTLNLFAEKIQSYCNSKSRTLLNLPSFNVFTVLSGSDLSSANDPFCAQGNDLAVHLAYPKEFDDAGAAFVNKRFQGQQALAKAQGASAAGTSPTPASSLPPAVVAPATAPPPAAATLVRPGIKSQTANSTVAAVSIVVSKTIEKPWAFAMKSVARPFKVANRRERTPRPAANGQWDMAKRLLTNEMGGDVV
jgi:hypothetical protein